MWQLSMAHSDLKIFCVSWEVSCWPPLGESNVTVTVILIGSANMICKILLIRLAGLLLAIKHHYSSYCIRLSDRDRCYAITSENHRHWPHIVILYSGYVGFRHAWPIKSEQTKSKRIIKRVLLLEAWAPFVLRFSDVSCCEVTPSYVTTLSCCMYSAPIQRMRRDYVAMCISHFWLWCLTKRMSMRCLTKRTNALIILPTGNQKTFMRGVRWIIYEFITPAEVHLLRHWNKASGGGSKGRDVGLRRRHDDKLAQGESLHILLFEVNDMTVSERISLSHGHRAAFDNDSHYPSNADNNWWETG